MPVRTFPNAPGGGGSYQRSKIVLTSLPRSPESQVKSPVILIFFKSYLVESFESFLFHGLLPFQNRTDTIFSNDDYSVSKSPPYLSCVSNPGFQINFFPLIFFHQEIVLTIIEATMESTLLEAIQREEVMTKHWDCKLVFKKRADQKLTC
jgi:hypothetical protein